MGSLPAELAASKFVVELAPEPASQFRARVVGWPEVQCTAGTREEAVAKVRQMLQDKWNSGQFVLLSFPPGGTTLPRFGHAKDDPGHDEYLEEIQRFRAEMDRAFPDDQRMGPCSSSSSTPTT